MEGTLEEPAIRDSSRSSPDKLDLLGKHNLLLLGFGIGHRIV